MSSWRTEFWRSLVLIESRSSIREDVRNWNFGESEENMKTRELTEYDKQAQEFTERTGLIIHKSYCGHYKRFEDAIHISAQWRIGFFREGKTGFWFNYSDSVHNSFSKSEAHRLQRKPLSSGDYRYLVVKEILETGATKENRSGLPFTLHYEKNPPTDYDILACLTKYDPGTFEDFCGDFGCDTDSRKAEQTYFAVQKEYQNLRGMFTEPELENMAEIQ